MLIHELCTKSLDFAVLFVALCSAERQREVTEADAPRSSNAVTKRRLHLAIVPRFATCAVRLSRKRMGMEEAYP